MEIRSIIADEVSKGSFFFFFSKGNLKNEDGSYCSTTVFNLYTFSSRWKKKKKNSEKKKEYLGICRGGEIENQLNKVSRETASTSPRPRFIEKIGKLNERQESVAE